MAKRRSQPTPKSRSSGSNGNNLGIFALPDFDGDDDDDDVNDADLEAELNAILSEGSAPVPKPRAKPKVPAPPTQLDKMVASSLQDIPSDAELSGDDDDPELLAELSSVLGDEVPKPAPAQPQVIAPTFHSQDYVKLIAERLEMYKQAEQNAKINGDSSKSRRLARGLKTLEELLRKAKSGVAINENDIPLPVSVTAPKPKVEDPPQYFEPIPIDGGPSEPVAPVAPEGPSENKTEQPVDEPVDNEKQELLKTLIGRKDEYKSAAVVAKRSGEVQTAISYVKIVKQFETVIAAVESGQPVDLSKMPGPPGSEKPEMPPEPIPAPSDTPKNTEPEQPEMPEGPKVPETILEALEQRLVKFKEGEEAGKKDGNASKVRRMGRIVKQYEDAIKLHKAGKPFPVDDLPTPPGFAPIPVNRPAPPESTAPSTSTATSISTPLPPQRVLPSPPAPRQVLPSPSAPQRPPPSPSTTQSGSMTRQEKQLKILKLKQKQFKDAAIKAKQSGDIDLAKDYLRQVKCFDPLIDATISGIPVDLSTLPPPPGSKDVLEKEYEMVKMSDCLPGTTSEIYNQLITDLSHQIKICLETHAHFKAMGDVANMNKFENLALTTKRDLDTVKIACNKDEPVPKFHYEMRTFSVVRCNTDLTDNDVELTIAQGINYNVPNPKEIDTYVRYEFPYPTDDPKKDKTSTIYNTNNPVYNGVILFSIQRSNRACLRIFKRQSIKLEVWSKGGFLRSDVLIGTVNVKLNPLETQCTIHDSFDLMNGKKVVGGKLEVKVRVRHPILTKQVEQMKEKWLVID